MREIKFRQRNINNGQWHYWGFINNCWVNLMEQDNYWPPEKSQQYTGLKDKHGKELYENDIILLPENTARPEGIRIIEWWGEYGLKLYNPKAKYRSDMHSMISYIDQNVAEVIGNIYDNPELMEVKQ